MGVLDWLDPTRSWPVVAGPAPDLHRLLLQFENLRFNASIESAESFGRPDTFHWTNRLHKDCELLYASKGLQLGFKDGKLRDVRFLIGAKATDHAGFKPAQPMAPDGSRLTAQTSRDQIVAIFGQPDPGGSDETCLQIFHGNGIASDFYVDPTGHLTEWAIYPDD